MTSMTAITRPNGKLYRPRKLAAWPVCDDDGIEVGVIVLGTHDFTTALPLAVEEARRVDARCTAVDPVEVWWREAMVSGERRWVDDPERGRAGVWFREIVEATP